MTDKIAGWTLEEIEALCETAKNKDWDERYLFLLLRYDERNTAINLEELDLTLDLPRSRDSQFMAACPKLVPAFVDQHKALTAKLQLAVEQIGLHTGEIMKLSQEVERLRDELRCYEDQAEG